MEILQNVIPFFTENWPEILVGLTSIIGGFAVLAKFTPNKSDDKFFQFLWDIVNSMGQNAGNATNSKKG